ncbi:glycosyltransferase family 2 protein [Rhodobacteraceae bacterium]|nr:glycosyltransferase family 2 protein [Paracoccaceae bacterium]
MRITAINELEATPAVTHAEGPVAAIIAEDEIEVEATIRHHIGIGFKQIILFAPDELILDPGIESNVIRVDFPTLQVDTVTTVVNALCRALSEKTWLYYCYNAEFLYFPFCESRTIGEALAFHTEERRFSMLTYVIDLYAPDLRKAPNAVSLEDAHIDRSGYYALTRHDEAGPKDRQLDFFGGLRWRFEEHIDETRRRIDRISLVRSRSDITLRADHTWSDDELNTFSCPWHHNLTASVASFRTAKALRINPASSFSIDTFRWHNSVPFEWKSQQLLDLGLMESGQWF